MRGLGQQRVLGGPEVRHQPRPALPPASPEGAKGCVRAAGWRVRGVRVRGAGAEGPGAGTAAAAGQEGAGGRNPPGAVELARRKNACRSRSRPSWEASCERDGPRPRCGPLLLHPLSLREPRRPDARAGAEVLAGLEAGGPAARHPRRPQGMRPPQPGAPSEGKAVGQPRALIPLDARRAAAPPAHMGRAPCTHEGTGINGLDESSMRHLRTELERSAATARVDEELVAMLAWSFDIADRVFPSDTELPHLHAFVKVRAESRPQAQRPLSRRGQLGLSWNSPRISSWGWSCVGHPLRLSRLAGTTPAVLAFGNSARRHRQRDEQRVRPVLTRACADVDSFVCVQADAVAGDIAHLLQWSLRQRHLMSSPGRLARSRQLLIQPATLSDVTGRLCELPRRSL